MEIICLKVFIFLEIDNVKFCFELVVLFGYLMFGDLINFELLWE